MKKLYYTLLIVLFSFEVFSAPESDSGNFLIGVASGSRKEKSKICKRAKENALRQVKTICSRTKRGLSFNTIGCVTPKGRGNGKITVNYKLRYQCLTNQKSLPKKKPRPENKWNM